MSFDQIPDEIIQHLLYYVSPSDTLCNVQLLSSRLNRLSNEPLLWRFHCRCSFQHWHPDHDIDNKLKANVTEVDWKRLFLLRRNRTARIYRLFDAILKSKVGRLRRFEEICRLGYDAKDFLLEQCQTPDSAEDVLARRHYSNAVLDSIHRSIALEEWNRLRIDREDQNVEVAQSQLERALAAFDMFVLHDQPGDIEEISQMLDARALEFQASQPNLADMTTREKALALNRWLRMKNLTGVNDPEKNYRNLRNCLIGQALRHEDHESIPIVSTAIFCSMALRIGINAQCCAFPSHVHAIVFSAPGKTLDGTVALDGELREKMYLDPFKSNDEVPVSALQSILMSFGWQTSTDVLLAPVSAQTVALRTAQNMRLTLTRILELQDQAHPELSQLMHGNNALNVEASMYSTLWAYLMLTTPTTFDWEDRLATFLRQFAGSWPEDAWLVEKYLWPKYNSFLLLREGFARNANQGIRDPWGHWRLVRDQDSMEPPIHRRSLPANHNVPFKIGQVFRHRRYGWTGVITGWSDQGTRHLPVADSRPVAEHTEGGATTQPDVQVRPPNQFYFMCFPSTGSEPHVVAAESIELIHEATQVSNSMFPLAGKFFKRFDHGSCTFVSNIKEQYPDD